jgi:hypothetical protein
VYLKSKSTAEHGIEQLYFSFVVFFVFISGTALKAVDFLLRAISNPTLKIQTVAIFICIDFSFI